MNTLAELTILDHDIFIILYRVNFFLYLACFRFMCDFRFYTIAYYAWRNVLTIVVILNQFSISKTVYLISEWNHLDCIGILKP